MKKLHYERNLPHFQPTGATFFLTYRLQDSIPTQWIQQTRSEFEALESAIEQQFLGAALATKRYKLQKRYFQAYDAALDTRGTGPTWLAQPEIAQIIADSLHHLDGTDCTLYTYTIMPNHVHVVFKHHESARPLYRILQSHKSFTGKMANRLLKRDGQFWQRETYDHVVRGEEEFQRILQYVIDNPVKARLVKQWGDSAFTYIRSDLLFQ